MGRSKRLKGSLTRPRSLVPPEGGSAPKVELLQTLIFVFLVADVLADDFFVAPDGRDEVPSGPEVLPYEISLALPVHTS